MPRLRTTTSLSLLLLLGGIAGTGWLSTLTTGWTGPAVPFIAAHHRPANARATVQRHARVAMPARRTAVEVHDDVAVAAPVPPRLEPLAMPSDTSQPWYKLRGHLDGRVVVHVDTNGSGYVDRASLVESSGDPILDEHALRSVRGWRFAVPVDQSGGVSGELPMSFSSSRDRVASAP